MKCPICNNPTKVLYSELFDRLHPNIPGKYTLKQCINCRLIFIDPQPSKTELLAHYPDAYGIYQRSIKECSKKFLIIKAMAKEYFGYGKSKRCLKFLLLPFYFKLSHLPYYVENGKLLDIGCGVGDRMLIFKELGWNVEGLEIDQKVAKVASDNTKCKIYVSTLEEANLPKDNFDVVYLNHVFEHLKDPHQALRKINNILKHNGQLIIAVPNENSLAFKLFKQHWSSLDVPRHMFIYNKVNLSTLLHQYGFNIKKIIYAYSLTSITSSIAYKFGKHADAFSYFDKLIWILSFFLDPIFNIFGICDCMTVHATLAKRRS